MRRDYFARLTAAARWRMPPEEAEEFLADYREILEENPRPEEALYRELGTPWRAAGLAADRRLYWRWLAVFAALALCLLLPALYRLVPTVGWLLGTFFRPLAPEVVLTAVGTAGVLLFFRRRGQGPVERRLWVLLFLPPALLALVNWWVWGDLSRHLVMAGGRVWNGFLAQGGYVLVGLLAAGLGLWGLVSARLRDRRWRSLYVTALATAALCCSAVMILRDAGSLQAAWDAYLRRCAVIAGVGLVGTGVALC